ncbi:hypothetical protein Pve01_24580 [Planomonospora venezuelensis]|nr:hypothetical protein Pve01_24580 [Planomonospora venezuelensis]
MFVDVHGHLAAPGGEGFGPPSLFDAEGSIAAKQALGIDLTIIGSPCGAGSMRPGSGAANYAQSADQVRAYNEAIGDLVGRFPGALRAYAYLDPFGGDAMLSQAAELVKDWRFVGLIVNTSVNGEYLDSAAAGDFFAMAAETGVPVLLHPPAEPVGTSSVRHPGLVEHVARPGDVTMGVAALICAGWLERHPGLRLIAAAGGGGLAGLLEKLDLAVAPRPGAEPSRLASRPSESLRRIFVETSVPSRVQLRANLEVFGAGNILFGTDAPPLMNSVSRILDAVRSEVTDEEELRGISRGNASRLFALTEELVGDGV